MVRADCVEATEFPELASRYGVYAVPKTVINEEFFIEGALPEKFFLEGILKNLGLESVAAGSSPPSGDEESPRRPATAEGGEAQHSS